MGFAALFLALDVAISGGFVWAGAPLAVTLSWWTVPPPLLAALGASWALVVRLERRPLSTLGLRGDARGASQLGLGVLTGLALMGAVLLVFAVFGWVSWAPTPDGGSPLATALGLAGLLGCAAFAEELLFRGYPFQVLLRRFGPVVALLGTSAAFGALHAGNPGAGPLALINITLAGVLLGVAYFRTGSLWFATGVHLGWNWVMAVSELSVSGIATRMPGFDPVLSGPTRWTGGDFGPEGGLTVTIVTIVGTIWLWRLGGRDERLSDLRTGILSRKELPESQAIRPGDDPGS